jgi:phosphotransferase system enzyme I (PtsI)
MHVIGIGIGSGVAIGTVIRMPDPLPDPEDVASDFEPFEELERALAALSATAADLIRLGSRAGGEAQEVLETEALMAEDPAIIEDVDERIASGKSAERAVFEAFRNYAFVLESAGDYMAGRAADLRDVSARAVAHLRGVAVPGIPQSDAPFVLVARDLAPADTATLDLDRVLAFVTRDGGPTSHTAILARAKSIVAIVGAAGSDQLDDGDTVIVDSAAGTVISEPSAAEITAATSRSARPADPNSLAPGQLADGSPIALLANVGNPSEAAAALALGAEGIGLFRTEFLFLDASSAPSVEAQREQYISLFRVFAGKRVVVRVLDAGADKQLSFLGPSHEENPALGRRGLRALRDSEHILQDQFTALAQAQAETGADLWVMAPMVADAGETRYFVDLGRSFGLSTLGVTIEVPSAAVLADQIVGLTDFVSIGTNDLTQYTLAADRMLGTVSRYQDPWHPAVLRLIKMIGDASNGVVQSVGVCGEAAADPLLAVVLVGLGATDLSMSPVALGDVRAELRRHTLEEARNLATLALEATSAAAAREVVAAAIAAKGSVVS